MEIQKWDLGGSPVINCNARMKIEKMKLTVDMLAVIKRVGIRGNIRCGTTLLSQSLSNCQLDKVFSPKSPSLELTFAYEWR
jgi:hypothetical protein